MGLSTHVLDTMHGCPAANMHVELYRTEHQSLALLKSFNLNSDGRANEPLFTDHTIKTGTYRLVFDVKDYFVSQGVTLPEPAFLDRVSIDFGIAHTDQHYHVPLLVSPWSYSTYRGS